MCSLPQNLAVCDEVLLGQPEREDAGGGGLGMPVSSEQARQELERFLQDSRTRKRLERFLDRAFPRLRDFSADPEDVLQDALKEVVEVLQASGDKSRRLRQRRDRLVSQLDWYLQHGWSWPEAWRIYLQRLLRWRAIDRLRGVELEYFNSLSESTSSASRTLGELRDSAAASPSSALEEGERRWRQVRLLSDIFRDFVAWCEQDGQGLKKEVYERRLRGQNAKTIAHALHLQRNHVDQLIKRVRDWIRNEIEKRDVHHSIFITLAGPVGGRAPATKAGAGRFANFADVLDFVVHEMGALCPSETRLWHYHSDPENPAFHDVHYHVREAKCCICLAELER